MKIKDLIKKNEINILQDFQQIVRINSVYDESTVSETKPYGAGVDKAYKWILDKANSDGFIVKNWKNTMGSILLSNEQDDYIAAIGHLDVVPVSGKWKHGIFEGNIVDNFIWGRGTQDDKGPVIATYWAMKFAKQILGKDIKKDFRLMVGTNEERGMEDLKDFVNSDEKKPTFSITPDAIFPGIYAEKHMTDVSLYFERPTWMSQFNGGDAINMVIGQAEVWTSDGKGFTKKGKSAHGSTPSHGKNAATMLFVDELKRTEGEFADLMKSLHEDFEGKTLGVDYYDEELGNTSCNLGIVATERDEVLLKFNIRIPASVDWDKFQHDIDNIVNKIPSVKRMEKSKSSKGYISNTESKEFQILINSYQKVTGDKENKPLAIGGGTYARNIDNCVPFGLIMPGSETFFHQIDERMNLDDFFKGIEILTEAIIELVK